MKQLVLFGKTYYHKNLQITNTIVVHKNHLFVSSSKNQIAIKIPVNFFKEITSGKSFVIGFEMQCFFQSLINPY